jgi:acetyltransferase-like isoleucine patch superfamily enzyme
MINNSNIDATAIIHPSVKIGDNVLIGAFCIIGQPSQGKQPGEEETSIGDNAVIRSHTVIYASNKIGHTFNTGHHVVIRENNRIGNNVSIGTQTCIEHHIQIDDDVRIHSQVFVPEYSKLENGSWLGPNVVLTNAKYPRGKNVKELLDGVTICQNAKVGANVTILPGVNVGRNALIGSGSVVTKNVEENSVSVGNPAKKISRISEIQEYN